MKRRRLRARPLIYWPLVMVFAMCGGVAVNLASGVSSSSMQAETGAKRMPFHGPPMGWSSWNSFSNTIDSAVAMEQAKAMSASGLKARGYEYINIDEGWWLGTRDGNGDIVVDAKQWPAIAPGEHAGDMSNIVKYIHSLGLKAGIYTDAGEAGCGYYGPDLGPRAPHTGSEGHYEQDFLQFAKWGFDYVKVDWCGGNHENLDPAVQYAEIARAIGEAEAATGHPLFYSICNWGKNSPWTWAPGIGGLRGDIWRTSGDIVAPIVANTKNANRRASFTGVLSNFDKGIHPQAEHTGFYNDPDMMLVGMPGLSDAENRAHMALWAISGAPLILGADLSKLSAVTLATVTNPDVIAVDQDSLGLQSVEVAEPAPGYQVWAKRMTQAGERAVVLLNRTASPAAIAVDWKELGLEPSVQAKVRDLWAQRDLGSHSSSYSAQVPSGDAVMLLVKGAEEKMTRYPAASSRNGFSGGAAPIACSGCAGGKNVPLGGDMALSFRGVRSAGKFAAIQIVYVNGSKKTVTAELRVNGQTATRIAFPPTGGETTAGVITMETNLDPSSVNNSLTFSAPCSTGLAIDSIAVLAGLL